MKEQLYLRAFVNTNQKAVEKGAYTHDDIKKLVFYGGHKYECKDYCYTMEYMDTLERDKQIKEQNIDNGSVIGFLWEYHNWEIRRFAVTLITSLSRLQRLQGQLTVTDKLFDMLSIEPLTIYESNGKQFLLNTNGKTVAVYKPLPRYLKQLK